ncbi:hypothetical protein [Deinococcus arcticus]|uniref:Uncharacterized protein n=1 Tax=Deinococcus arcticus TaxID=2136176 RepID=A0A2T3W487_9DEIO|nr:hypothetical protein [Deinococcus arcticus]PTA66614.1 hypothetical protein C8263_17075 [Deinococcus arcticus]
MRKVILHLAARYGTKVVDTSSEVTDSGQIGHWAAMPTHRILVSDKKEQPKLIRQAYANHSPMFIAVDEIGHHGDADVVASTVDREAGMVATCHGETLTNVVNTPTFWSVMGAMREQGLTRQRMTEATFDVAVAVRGVGRFVSHDRMSQAVDEVLAGRSGRRGGRSAAR